MWLDLGPHVVFAAVVTAVFAAVVTAVVTGVTGFGAVYVYANAPTTIKTKTAIAMAIGLVLFFLVLSNRIINHRLLRYPRLSLA